MIKANIRIQTSSGRLIDYISPESLNIKMNRKIDDLQNIESRFGEYSLSFTLPLTRNNYEIFEFAGVVNIKNSFKINPIDIQVFNNDVLILTGQLELRSILSDGFDCVFYSKFTQLIDDLKDKNMQDITTCPKIPWNYELTISNHLNNNYSDCDDTPYQFPFVYYNTWFCPTSVFTGLTDTIVDVNGTTNHLFQSDRAWQNWYYYINHSSIGENEAYFHQIPLAFYLKPMMEYLLSNIGWSMGGSFWENQDIKKIIVPYVGDTDVYDRACYCSNGSNITGSTCGGGGTLMLDTSKFMPDYNCADFLKDIMLTFNLYFNIDILNKTIIFETYDTMFGSKIAPYDLTNNLVQSTISINKVEDYNPSINWSQITNQRVLGDNRYFASTGTSSYNATYLVTANQSLFNQVYNHIGSTNGEIKIGLQAPAVKRARIRNDYNYADTNNSAGDHVMFLPFISTQLPEDNNNRPFNKKDSYTTVYNNESTIQYKGKPCLYYYYGISSSDFVQKTSMGSQSDYFYINFNDVNQKIGICSPFAYKNYRYNINKTIYDAGQNPTGSTNDVGVMLASYMQSIYLMMGNTVSPISDIGFSLIFSDNSDYGDTIYTKFHQGKYNRYQNSEVLSSDMRCSNLDWNNLQVNTPIKYNNQIYSLVELSDFDIVKQQAKIKMIKQL